MGPEPRWYTIDRISNSGNAIATSGANIGPLINEVVGEKIRGAPINGGFVFCVEDKYWSDNYQREFTTNFSIHSNTSGSSNSQSSTQSKKKNNPSVDSGEVLRKEKHSYEGKTSTDLGASLEDLVGNIESKSEPEDDPDYPPSLPSSRRKSSQSQKRSSGSNKTSQRVRTQRRATDEQNKSTGSGRSSIQESELVRQIRYRAYRIDGPIRRNHLYQESNLIHADVLNHFDSFDEAVESAGIDRQEECLDEIGYVAEKVGGLPGKKDVTEEGRVSPRFILRHFDSWTAVQEAYLARDEVPIEDPPKQLLLGELERLTGKRNFTDLVLYSDLEGSVFTEELYREKFGSLAAALEEIEVDPRQEITELLTRTKETVEEDIQPDHITSARYLEGEIVEETFGSLDAAIDHITADDADETTSEEDESTQDEITTEQQSNETHAPTNQPENEASTGTDPADDLQQSTAMEQADPKPAEEPAVADGSTSAGTATPVGGNSAAQEPEDATINDDDGTEDEQIVAEPETDDSISTDEEDEDEDHSSVSHENDADAESVEPDVEPFPPDEPKIFWNQDIETLSLADPGRSDQVGGVATTDEDSLDKRIDQWKSQCLDLTRRNHLINFTETKSKSLPLTGHSSTSVAESIAEYEKHYVTKKNPDASAQTDSTGVDSSELQSTRSPKETQKALTSIARHQKQYLRERGVDTLYLALGHLRWFSVDYSDEHIRSPLFLAPLELRESNVNDATRHNYVIQSQSEELRVNPALRQKLASDHGIALPPDSELAITNLDAAFETVHQVIQGQERWHIEDAIVLGIFDFTKYSVYEDLEENREQIKEDPIVRAIQGDTDPLKSREGDIETPSADELDAEVDPVDVYQVLDADSSQQEAIEAAKRGKSFVLQGPPGTGKSQTIANIIAEKIATGDRVLFVSEKQAALDVVKNRLSDVDLGRFCLEAHGQKATVKGVVSQLDKEIKSTRIKPAEKREQTLKRLRDRRQKINEYGDHLFYSPDQWDLTVYQAFGIVSTNHKAPYIETEISDPLAVSEGTVRQAINELETLAQFQDILQQYDVGPWTHATISDWSIETARSMDRSLREQQVVIDQLEEVADTVETQIGYKPDSLAELRDALSVLQHLSQLPDVQLHDQLLTSEFAQMDDQLHDLVEIERERGELLSELNPRYERSFFETNAAELNSELAKYGLFKILRPSYRSLRRQIRNHAKPDYDPSHSELVDDTQNLAVLQRLENQRDEYQHLIKRLGHLYNGSDTDWETVLEIQDWVAELHEYESDMVTTVTESITSGTIEDVSAVHAAVDDALTKFDSAASFFRSSMDMERVRIDGHPFEAVSLESLRDELEYLDSQVSTLQRRVQFNSQLETVAKTVCGEYVQNFLHGEYDPEELVPGFKKRFYTQWLTAVYDETGLGSFSKEQFDRYLTDFRQLDEEQQELARVQIQHNVLEQRPSLDLDHAADAEQVVVKREAKKQQQHKPLRQLFDEAGNFITQLTPCFMMSPLSVAQYLKPGAIAFDTVIFDEASQIMPHDAISSIIRADQVVIAGDSNQLPPTSFFNASIESMDGVRADLDSILEEASAVLPEKRLRWHYRSRDSELIAFSNHQYYNNSLQTFPDNDPDTETGVTFEYVSDGVYDRGNSQRNDREAERVVDLIEDHATTHSDKSLGVVAFSQSQQEAIRDELAERAQSDRVLKSFINQNDVLDEFFVKNLEAVQGDERDRMLFSIGYGPDQTGKPSVNFGPLNKSGGERRLNVAITRARERVTIVSSIQPEDIDLTGTNSTGVEDLKKYLRYAKDGDEVLARDQHVSSATQFDSQFEEAVYDTLTDRGFEVTTQIQSAGYSVDLAIKHPDKSGQFILGIECDGAAYHSSKTARDRDRTRQAILEDLGWTIHRIWSPDWISNKEREITRIEEKVETLLDSSTESAEYSQQPEVTETHDPEPLEKADTTTNQHPDISTYTEPSFETKRDIPYDEIPNEEIGAALKQIVHEAGPIDKDTAFRIVVSQWGISRIGKRINRSLASHAGALQRKGEIVRSGSFLWPPERELEFSIRVHDGDATRDIDAVPTEELAKAASLILSEGGRMTRKDLELEVSRLYGYQRRGKNIQAKFNAVIGLLSDIDAIEKENDRLDIKRDGDVYQLILSTVYS